MKLNKCEPIEKYSNFSPALSLPCRVDFRPEKGIYDLRITNASYNRDNGRFECRIKAQGTGDDVHQQYYNLTVLTPPQPPLVAPGNIVVATEEKKQELTCSSIGGSPDPTIT
jgi:echinoid protein